MICCSGSHHVSHSSLTVSVQFQSKDLKIKSGTVNKKDCVASSEQDNALLFVHPTLGIMADFFFFLILFVYLGFSSSGSLLHFMVFFPLQNWSDIPVQFQW